MSKNDFSNTKLAKLFSSLRKDEFKPLLKWLESPWAACSKKGLAYYQYILKYSSDLTSPKLDSKEVYKKLYANKSFSAGTIRNLMTELGTQMEAFLVHQHVRNNKRIQQKILVQEWIERHETEAFEKTITKEIDNLEKKEIKSSEDFRTLYDYYIQWYHHPHLDYRIQKGQYFLQKATDHLLTGFSMDYAPIVNEFKERQSIVGGESYELEKEIDLLNWLYSQYPSKHLELYLERIDTKNENALSRFRYLKNAFEKAAPLLSTKDQKIHYLSLLNDGMKLYAEKKLEMLPLLNLYKVGLENEYLLNYGLLSQRTFINMMGLSNGVGDFNFSDELINTYCNNLKKEKQQDARIWGEAHINYNINDFKKSEKALFQHTFKDGTFALLGKGLLLQVYFDLILEDEHDYFSSFLSYSLSYEKYISRHKILSEDKKKSFMRYTQMTRLLGELFYEPVLKKKDKIEKIITFCEKIHQENNIQGHDWLLKKAKQLINKIEKRL